MVDFFSKSPQSIQVSCNKCKRLLNLKTIFGNVVEVAVPGVVPATGALAILQLFDIKSMDDLLDSIDSLS